MTLSPASASTTPAASRQTRIIALMNQKGGVGKTTTTVNLGAALAGLDQRVLLIDLDPQSHMTLHVGIDPDHLEQSVYHLFTDPAVTAEQVVRPVAENLYALPAEVNLAGVESELAPLAASGQAQRVLKEKVGALLRGGHAKSEIRNPKSETDNGGVDRIAQPLQPVKAEASQEETKSSSETPDPRPETRPFDFILIDCPPSLGLLTINALSLATEVFVPMQAHFLALQGLSKLLETVGLVKRALNPALEVSGIILCMHEQQTVLAGEVVADLTSFLEAARSMDVPWRNAVVLSPPVRRNIKLAECPSFGKTIFDYAPWCPGAGDYRRLAEAVVDMKR